MAVCVAIIDKENSPLYIKTIADGQPDAELKFHYTVHSSLDIVEEKLGSHTSRSTDLRELYLGQLITTDEYKVFGYATNTKVKFILLLEASNQLMKDQEIRSIFRKLHNVYCDHVSNPFFVPGTSLMSRKLTVVVDDILKRS